MGCETDTGLHHAVQIGAAAQVIVPLGGENHSVTPVPAVIDVLLLCRAFWFVPLIPSELC